MKHLLDEFSSLMESAVISNGQLLISGDFNFHVDDISNCDAANFLDILDNFGLLQHVSGPTHRLGHTLDLIITRNNDSIISSKPVADHFISDHSTVICSLSIKKPCAIRKQITYRKIKDIDSESFARDISQAFSQKDNISTLSSLIGQYNSNLTNLINKHAPLKTKTITIRENRKWYSQMLAEGKRERRRLEEIWRGSKLEQDHIAYQSQKNCYNNQMSDAKSQYYCDLISEKAGDQAFLFKVADSLSRVPTE